LDLGLDRLDPMGSAVTESWRRFHLRLIRIIRR